MSAVIATRTPEGHPFRCPFCGVEDRVEPSVLTGDATCPTCGALVWPTPRRRPRLYRNARNRAIARELIDFDAWLRREMGDLLPRERIEAIGQRTAEVLEAERWGPVRRAYLFTRLRWRLRRLAWRLHSNPTGQSWLRRAIRGLQGSATTAAASTSHPDPLYDPWLDCG